MLLLKKKYVLINIIYITKINKMNFKNKKIITGGIIILIVIIAIIFFILQNQNEINNPPLNNGTEGMILFYGDTCPHCDDLEEWIQNNNIEEKVEFIKLEVYNNENNQKILIEKVKICDISINSVGVPFFWTGSECLIGNDLIQNFLQEKMNLDINNTTNEIVQ